MMLLAGVMVFAQGIKFENDSFKNLLDKAKKENKLIFMDAYASWCGPCKKMDKEVFTLPEVGEVYNSAFINTKIDMEKGEGVTIAQKYGVKAYPTYLFIDGNGEVIYRGTGYFVAPEFIKIAKEALDPNNKMSYLKAKFNSGSTEPVILKGVMKAFAYSEPELAEKAAIKYFETNKNQAFTEEDLMSLFSLTKDANSPLYKVVVNKKSEITNLMPESQYNQMLKSLQLNAIMKTAFNKETKAIDDKIYMKEATKFMTKEEAEKTLLQIKMRMALKSKKFADYQKLAIAYYKEGNDEKFSSNELNEVAWNFYENVTDKDALKLAVLWAEKSVKKDESYANTDTLANLYFKVGEKDNAKSMAEQAIKLAEKAGEDAASTKELLKKLQ